MAGPGVVEERIEVLTDAEIRARQAALRQGKAPLSGAVKRRDEYELDPAGLQLEKIRNYI
jgi:hypothetical protein